MSRMLAGGTLLKSTISDPLRPPPAALEPPSKEAIKLALAALQELSAVDEAGELTPLGHHVAELPVDARIGKMILYGAIFACLDPVR
eukprot:6910705-Pyramimonas_sp.AAC.1